MRLLIVALSLWILPLAAAEVIPVPSGDPTRPPALTLYWEGTGSRGVLILIPGGEGQLNLKPNQVDVGHQFYLTLKQLSQGADPKENFDVVLFDSPDRLVNARGYPTSRATDDHLSRIHGVVAFYREKTRKPIWLMGHSNGAISVTEYIRYERKRGQDNPVAGLILSSPRNLTYFDSTPLDFPILFMSHRRDSCAAADPNAALANFKRAQGLNKARTSFVFIESGRPEEKQPCYSGYHMYNGATQEVVAALRGFMTLFSP